MTSNEGPTKWAANTLSLLLLPPYNVFDTKNWFLQLLPSIVNEIADILEDVPENESYTTVKITVIKTRSP